MLVFAFLILPSRPFRFVDADLHLDRAGAVHLSRDAARQIGEAQQTVQENEKGGGYRPQGS